MNDHKFKVGVFNRTVSKVDHFLENEAKGTDIKGFHSIEELCKDLKSPRRVVLLVKAGKAVDDFIEMIIPHMDKGDIIIVTHRNVHCPLLTCFRTVEIRTTPTRTDAQSISNRKASCSSALECPVERKVHVMDHP